MDYTHIFNSDFLTSKMVDVMSPIELYHYKNTTKYINKQITLDIIHNKIILCVQNRLKRSLGDKYDCFIDIVAKRDIEFYGPFIIEAIYGDELDDTYINIRMTDKYMGTRNDNVFIDYKNIDFNTTFDPNIEFKHFEGWFSYESDRTIFLNNYETNIKDKIKLHIFSTDYEDTIPETYPEIFQNTIKIIKENNKYKWIITIKHFDMVMNKTQMINISNDNTYYCITSDCYNETNQLCNRNSISCKLNKLGHFILNGNELCHSLVVYDTKENKFTMFGKSFYSTKHNRISCDPIELVNSKKYTQVYIDVELLEFTNTCDHTHCPLKLFPLNHFHSCVFLKKENNLIVTVAIVLEYDNIPLFSKHTELFNDMSDDKVDNNIIEKLYAWYFPPMPISKNYVCTNINDYRKMFNNKFDSGEFAYIEPDDDLYNDNRCVVEMW